MQGKMRLHDWPISNMQPPDCWVDESIDLLATTDTVGKPHESPALALPAS